MEILFWLGAGVVGWTATEFLGRPVVEFLRIRREIITARLHALHTPVPVVLSAADIYPSGQLWPEQQALEEAKEGLRSASLEMLAFGQATFGARLIAVVGFDPIKIGEAAAAFANSLDEGIDRRAEYDRPLRQALHI